MTPAELLDRVRDYYVDRLSREIKEQRDAGRTVIVEPAYRDEDGGLVREGALELPARADLVISDGASAVEAIQVDTEQMLSFESFSFPLSPALTVECRPFQWNWCEVSLAPSVSFQPLVQWFNAWFPSEEKGDGPDLQSSVHFMSDPEIDGPIVRLAVDFGSAPVEALEQFLDAAEEAGATKVVLGA